VVAVTEPIEPQLRASDTERQSIADRLNAAVGEGRLTLEEFSDRVGSAYAARTHGELETLVADLPAPAGPAATAGRSPVMVDAEVVPPAPLDIKVGAIKRLGRWRLKKDNALGVAVGPIKLDLRGADLAAREITVSARTVVGAIKVWVPRGVRVEVEGTTAIGTRTVVESNLPPEMDVPTIRLRLDTWMGTVKVERTGDRPGHGYHQA
jgi:Domain of unknown function (DUF1707)/Cell wall-active antibiotics response 4TMS YvqF